MFNIKLPKFEKLPQTTIKLHQVHGSQDPQPLEVCSEETAQSFLKQISSARASVLSNSKEKSLDGPECELSRGSLLIKSEKLDSPFEVPVLCAEVASEPAVSSEDFATIAIVRTLKAADEESHRQAWIIVVPTNDLEEILVSMRKAGAIQQNLEDEYKLDVVVGSGTFSQVWSGNPIEGGDQIVAKRLKDSVKIADVQREVKMLIAAQGCQNTIKFHGLFLDPLSDCGLTIVLERASGGDLFDYIRNVGVIGEFGTWQIAGGILHALEHLQNSRIQIVHRDIKVENILLASTREVKLADFGLACYVDDEKEMARGCGSPGYAAPELLENKPYNCKVDCFGAGVILYFMLSGSLPFSGSDIASILRRNFRCRVNFESKNLHSVNKDALATTKALLMRDPAQRATAQEALSLDWLMYGPRGYLEDRHTFGQAALREGSGTPPDQKYHQNVNMEERHTFDVSASREQRGATLGPKVKAEKSTTKRRANRFRMFSVALDPEQISFHEGLLGKINEETTGEWSPPFMEGFSPQPISPPTRPPVRPGGTPNFVRKRQLINQAKMQTSECPATSDHQISSNQVPPSLSH